MFLPGGLGFALFLVFFAASSRLSGSPSSGCIVDPATGQELNCTNSSSSTSFMDVLAVVLLVAVVVTPIITTAYLGYRLRHRSAAATA